MNLGNNILKGGGGRRSGLTSTLKYCSALHPVAHKIQSKACKKNTLEWCTKSPRLAVLKASPIIVNCAAAAASAAKGELFPRAARGVRDAFLCCLPPPPPSWNPQTQTKHTRAHAPKSSPQGRCGKALDAASPTGGGGGEQGKRRRRCFTPRRRQHLTGSAALPHPPPHHHPHY